MGGAGATGCTGGGVTDGFLEGETVIDAGEYGVPSGWLNWISTIQNSLPHEDGGTS